MDVKPPFAVEGRSLYAVAHLAIARSQNPRTGILGEYMIIRAAPLALLFCVCSIDSFVFHTVLVFFYENTYNKPNNVKTYLKNDLRER